MKIFEKRPLAIILCVMVGGFSFFADFSCRYKLIFAAVPLIALGLIYAIGKLAFLRKPMVIIVLSALALSLILGALWSFTFYPREYYGQNVEIEARVYEIDNSDPYSRKMILKTDYINGKRDKHTLIAYTDKSTAVILQKYDEICFNAELIEFSGADDGFDGRTYYLSKGYSAILEDITSLAILGNRTDKIDAFFKTMQLKISNKLKLRTDFRTGAFLSALLVGNREGLSGNIKLNFARLGISHILALSGMHLAILSIAINFALSRMGVNKKLRITVMIILITFYMTLTGFSASVVRSGIMLIISGLLFLLSSKADGITSLSIAVFLIILLDPTSVYDLSLWLSAFATLGVIVFSELAEKPQSDLKALSKLWYALKNGCLVSVFAICSTFGFTALRYNGFSVVAVLTTLVFSFVIQIFIYGGLLLLLIGGIIPFGKLLIVFSDGILWLAEIISSSRLIYVSMNFISVKILVVLLSVCFFAFLIIDIKSKKHAISLICILLLAIFIVAGVNTAIVRNHDDVIYTPSDSGDAVLLKSDSEVSFIYSGRALSRGGRDILDYLLEEKLTYVDTFIFAGYSHSIIEFSNVIIDGIKVEKILLPLPTTTEELGQAEGLSYLLSEYGTDLEFYEPRKYIELGDYKYCLFEKTDYTYGKSPENVFEIVFDTSRITYVSACEYSLLSPSSKALLYNTENLIIGTSSSTSEYLFDLVLPDVMFIYCHEEERVAPLVTDYYKEKGALTTIVKTPLSFID